MENPERTRKEINTLSGACILEFGLAGAAIAKLSDLKF
jgi:hypothetical protein